MEHQGDSATFTLTDMKGFDLLYTIREKVGEKDFHDRVKKTSEMLDFDGYKPKTYKREAAQPSTQVKADKAWTGEQCPQDGGRLYKMITKTGKTMIKCENQKWDPKTKKASGCDYVEWEKEY